MNLLQICLIMVLAPLAGSIIAGIFGKIIGRANSHRVTIFLVGISFLCACFIAYAILFKHENALNTVLYTWADGGSNFPFVFKLGFLIDPLTAVMAVTVTFVSLLVHIYSIGYMEEDPGYSRFFSYISLFTFMMLMLITGNNFLQLFFGWEGVGLVSYLLIGFWFSRESANIGSLKAFIVNRVGDFGFILGIALLFAYIGSLDYAEVFKAAPNFANNNIITLICLLLFVGAMGKSAQVPLHVWLPESMEGPTPISALIHAATMVTAGVFMVARLSPLFEHSEVALSFILVIGATGALFTGILALVMNDIKRVVAYSTLSQLGYMMVAMGASAFSAGIFHLVTHACFKALLFLAAGSVIIGMHHEQDMRKMGGLYNKMPITYITFLIGSLALCALPPFAGFYSKDTIIEAAKLSTIPGSTYAYICVLIGAMVTALYTFRAFFMTFHGNLRSDTKVHESSWPVWLPLVILAVPSLIIGYILYMPMLFAKMPLLNGAVFVLPKFDVLSELKHEIISPMHSMLHAIYSPVFWLSILGIVLAFLNYIVWPKLPSYLADRLSLIYKILQQKYGFDWFNDKVFVKGTRGLGRGLDKVFDAGLIDNFIVNGAANTTRRIAARARNIQTGYLYHYATWMVVAIFILLGWLLCIKF